MRGRPEIPGDIEDHRDYHWRREGMRQVETAIEAERFIEHAGFAFCLTDCRRPGPSLYVAVCGRRDAVMPRNVQKDEEASLTWVLKDEIIARGQVYYAKLSRGKAMFIARRMIPFFHAIWGVRKVDEPRRLSRKAQAILRALRREWEMSTSDLREESGIKNRAAFTKALDELQAAQGSDVSAWQWSRAHVARSEHRPFSRVNALARWFELRTPVGGDTYTVNVSRVTLRPDPTTGELYLDEHGPSLRALYDLGDPSQSRVMHSSGQSGNVFSPLYRDFVGPWTRLEYVPLWSAPPVSTLLLQPAR